MTGIGKHSQHSAVWSVMLTQHCYFQVVAASQGSSSVLHNVSTAGKYLGLGKQVSVEQLGL